MLLPQKFQKLYLTPKLLKIKFSYLLVFLFYNCSSLPFISDRCDFPEQVLEPGGILNLKKNDINHNLLHMDYLECGSGNNKRIIAPIAYNSDKRLFEVLGVKIEEKSFRNSYIKITDKKFNQISKVDLIRIENERKKYINVLEKEYIATNLTFPLLKPTKGITSSEYGVKRFINNVQRNPHLGLDIAAEVGTPVYAAADGLILLSDNFFYRGKFVLIGHDNNFKSSYSHLSEILVKQNEIVKKGQLIGLMGKSGRVTGSHLHFEVLFFNKKLNPVLFIQ